MSLRDLYQEIILDHGKTPRNFGRLENASHSQMGHNPLCGDKLVLYVQATEDHIMNIHFVGEGCAISMASASLMTEAVKGKTIADMETLLQSFHGLVTEGKEANVDMGKLVAFAGVHAFPVRVKCATLPWHTLKAALNNAGPATTEE